MASNPNKGSGSAAAPAKGPAIQSTNGRSTNDSAPSRGVESRNWPGQRQSPYPPRTR